MHPLLPELGIEQQDVDDVLHSVRAAPSRELAEQVLEIFKAKVRRGWRRRAFELHPDRNGGDEEKTRRFVALQQLVQKVEAMRVDWQRPYFRSVARPDRVYPYATRVTYVWVTVSAGGTTTTESASGPAPPDWALDDEGALGAYIDQWLRAGRRAAW